MATVEVLVPYNIPAQDLKLDPAAVGHSADEAMGIIVDNVPWEDPALERIMRGAVCLFTNYAGTWGECLHTALIWETG